LQLKGQDQFSFVTLNTMTMQDKNHHSLEVDRHVYYTIHRTLKRAARRPRYLA